MRVVVGRMRVVLAAMAVAILAVALAACSGQPAASEPPVVGTTWQWQRFDRKAEGDSIAAANPESYTLTLQEDGTAAIQADCNQLSWTYAMAGNALTFDTLGPTTLAFCGEESLGRLYVEVLPIVATYLVSEGTLRLGLQADSGNMVFVPAE